MIGQNAPEAEILFLIIRQKKPSLNANKWVSTVLVFASPHVRGNLCLSRRQREKFVSSAFCNRTRQVFYGIKKKSVCTGIFPLKNIDIYYFKKHFIRKVEFIYVFMFSVVVFFLFLNHSHFQNENTKRKRKTTHLFRVLSRLKCNLLF